VAGLALLCGLIFDQLYRTRSPTGPPVATGPRAQETSVFAGGPQATAAAAPRPLPRERQPWEAKRGDAPVPQHHVPAWAVNPPRPDPNEAPPRPSQEPPGSPDYRPPTHNPGGVNGDRPARPVPGLD
jgi:hypothetical protein